MSSTDRMRGEELAAEAEVEVEGAKVSARAAPRFCSLLRRN
jgi:hypothetical protein